MKVDKLDFFVEGMYPISQYTAPRGGYIYAMTGIGTYDWKPTKDNYLSDFTLRLA